MGSISHYGTLYLADDVHEVNLASLDGEFCAVRTAERVIEEMAS